jgi:hypothetical protein
LYSLELVAVLEKLSDINDDLYHGRDGVRDQIDKAKALLDKLAAKECP